MSEVEAAMSRSPIYSELGMPGNRTAEEKGARALPDDLVLVSADNHYSVAEDIFYENFPSRLRDQAPRILRDETGFPDVYVNGESIFHGASKVILRGFDEVPGCSRLAERVEDITREGVSKEIAFPNGLLALVAAPHIFPQDVRDAMCEVYNDHIASLQQQASGMFYGVGIINHTNIPELPQALKRIRERGIRTIILPINPRDGDGNLIDYCSPAMAPFWEAIEEAGLPVCMHIAENLPSTLEPGGMAVGVMANLSPLRVSIAQLIFGGIFDRHPSLQAVFVECDINWVPGAMQSADMICAGYGELLTPKIKQHPWDYWHTNCHATFMSDPAGLRMLDQIGAGRVMWSTDYPHHESVFGSGWTAVEEIWNAVPEQDARRILGLNAIELFGLN